MRKLILAAAAVASILMLPGSPASARTDGGGGGAKVCKSTIVYVDRNGWPNYTCMSTVTSILGKVRPR